MDIWTSAKCRQCKWKVFTFNHFEAILLQGERNTVLKEARLFWLLKRLSGICRPNLVSLDSEINAVKIHWKMSECPNSIRWRVFPDHHTYYLRTSFKLTQFQCCQPFGALSLKDPLTLSFLTNGRWSSACATTWDYAMFCVCTLLAKKYEPKRKLQYIKPLTSQRKLIGQEIYKN